jgi:hypothetical protein
LQELQAALAIRRGILELGYRIGRFLLRTACDVDGGIMRIEDLTQLVANPRVPACHQEDLHNNIQLRMLGTRATPLTRSV